MHFRKNNSKWQYTLVNMVLLLLMLTAFGQTLQAQTWGKESLTRGKVWMTVHNAFRLGEVDLPWPFYSMDYPGHSTGSSQWDKPSYLEAGGYAIYAERGGVPVAHTLNGKFYASSQYMYPTADAELVQNFNLADQSIKAEEIVSGAFHLIDLDVDISHESMVWSYPKYDDFVIHEFTITNTGSDDLTNLHFGTRLAIWNTARGDILGPGDNYDDKYGWDETAGLFYVYDDRAFLWETEVPVSFNHGPGPTTGDIGDPADITQPGSKDHELLSPAYVTSICLDPAGGSVNMNILEFTGQESNSDGPPEDFLALLGAANFKADLLSNLTHQQPHLSWDDAKAAGGEGGNKFERNPEMLVSAGALTLAAGESVTLVFAEVFGEMDRAKIVAGGAANVALLATESKAALLANVAAARELYAAGYAVDDPPPTPTDGENSLALTPIGGGMQIEWPAIPDSYRDPDSDVNDLAGYRIYRSTHFVTGPWTLVDDLTLSEVTMAGSDIVYEDTDLSLGVGYYYGVTSYDTDGNESGMVNANRFPEYPLRAPNDDFPDQDVLVVPNPFRQTSGLLGSGEDLRMEFIGLPGECTISIYTIAGELVKRIEHNDGSGAEAWGSLLTLDYQTNEWFLYIAPGFYVYHVESHVPASDGESFVGKFAIIR